MTVEQNTRLTDILDTGHLQQLQDAFAAVAGITTVIIDPQGAPLTKPSNLYGFCELMQSLPGGLEKCGMTNEALLKRNRETRDAAVLFCPHSGLSTAAVPILLGEQHLGSWIIGQARLKDPPPGVLAQTACDLGLDEPDLHMLIESLPALTSEEFDRIFNFLKTLSQSVVQLGNARLQMAAGNAELQKLAQRLEQTTSMQRTIVDSSDIGLYVTDFYTGEILMVNRFYLEAVELEEEQVIGQKCWDISGSGGGAFCDYCARDRLLDENGKPNGTYHWENYNPVFDVWLRLADQAIYWVDGRLAHMVTFIDVSSEHQLRAELEHLAYYDRQLGLPNDLLLLANLRETQGMPGRFLLCFDVRMLRRVNDAYGRRAGDLLLEAVTQWVRGRDFGEQGLYRVEGDEFCLLFTDADAARTEAVAHTVYDRFQDAWVLEMGGQEISVLCGVSVSVLEVREDTLEEGVESLIERTLDISRERGCVAVYDEAMDEDAKKHTRMEMSLRRCVKAGMQGFAVFYQPIVDPGTRTWRGIEALCRWTDPESGPVSPLVFIREAEQMGLIGELGLWVLETAIAQCKQWHLDEMDGFFLSVNLSPEQVMDEGLVEDVTGLLKRYDYPGTKLSLEITESLEFTFNNFSVNVIDKLRFRGVRFSLDDFGTGYSSFNNLKNLPVSTLKTEREFLKGIDRDSYMQYFFYSMAELAHAADMKLIAEGIETREQLEIILKNGADYVQGYLFSKPLPAEEFGGLLHKFSETDPIFTGTRIGNIMQLPVFSGKGGYMIAPNLFRILNQTMQVLLTQVDLDAAFDEVLRIVGEYFNVSRTYVFMRRYDTVYSNTHEWCAEGVAPQKEFLSDVDIGTMDSGWLPTLARDGIIIASDIGTLPRETFEVLNAQEIRAVVVLPMMDGGEMLGFVGFDDLHYREWLPEEVALLRNLCMTMATALRKVRLQQEVRQNDMRFSDVLNHVGVAVMVTDPDTDEILWANRALRENYELSGSIVGRKCYQVLHGLGARCGFCKKDRLTPSPLLNECTWELSNERTGRNFVAYDSLADWEGGRKVHLQYSFSVGRVLPPGRQQEWGALSLDSMTRTLNRESLVPVMSERIEQACREEIPLSIALVDIDGLKLANDQYGYGPGDDLLRKTADVLTMQLGERDLIGRWGSDEFAVLMVGLDVEKAGNRLEIAREALKKVKLVPSAAAFTFSYGVVAVSEVAREKGRGRLNTLMDVAGERLSEYRKGHVGQAAPTG